MHIKCNVIYSTFFSAQIVGNDVCLNLNWAFPTIFRLFVFILKCLQYLQIEIDFVTSIVYAIQFVSSIVWKKQQ